MKDPERLLDGAGDADALEREVLGELRAQRASEHDRARAWQGIAAGVAAATAVSAGGATAAATGNAAVAGKAAVGAGVHVIFGTAAKIVIATAVGGAALGGAYVLQRGRAGSEQPGMVAPAAQRTPRANTSTPPQQTALPVAPERPAVEPATPEALPVAPREASAHAVSKPKPDERLALESAGLEAARSQLRAHDIAAAQATLQRLAQTFPHGALTQEREVLAIEVAIARGDSKTAKRGARSFVLRYPNSPHSTKLRSFLAEP